MKTGFTARFTKREEMRRRKEDDERFRDAGLATLLHDCMCRLCSAVGPAGSFCFLSAALVLDFVNCAYNRPSREMFLPVSGPCLDFGKRAIWRIMARALACMAKYSFQ